MRRPGVPRQQGYAINRRRIGDGVVTLINDGFEDFSFDILSDNITEVKAKCLLEAAGLPPIPRMSVNAYVIQDGHRTTLIDSGDGNCLRTGGRLQSALAAANIEVAQINTILLTHAHPDHVGGLTVHEAIPVFTNAELVLHEAELRFWCDDANFGESRKHLHAVCNLARNTFEAYRPSLRRVTSGEVIPGVAA